MPEQRLFFDANISKTNQGQVQAWRNWYRDTDGGYDGCKEKYGMCWKTLHKIRMRLQDADIDWKSLDIEMLVDKSLSGEEQEKELIKALGREYGIPCYIFDNVSDLVKKWDQWEKEYYGRTEK